MKTELFLNRHIGPREEEIKLMLDKIGVNSLEKLIEETKDGRYQLTKYGSETAQDVDKINDIVKNQLDVLFRLGNVGRFVALDLLEKISSMGSILSSNLTNMTDEETQKYRKFLQDELNKMDGKKVKEKGKEIKIE